MWRSGAAWPRSRGRDHTTRQLSIMWLVGTLTLLLCSVYVNRPCREGSLLFVIVIFRTHLAFCFNSPGRISQTFIMTHRNNEIKPLLHLEALVSMLDKARVPLNNDLRWVKLSLMISVSDELKLDLVRLWSVSHFSYSRSNNWEFWPIIRPTGTLMCLQSRLLCGAIQNMTTKL